MRLRRAVSAGAVAAAVLVIAACGSSKSSSTSSTSPGAGSSSGGKTVDIYSSLPLQGAVNVDTIPMVNGIKLALSEAGGKAGQFTVNYVSLDDSTATSAATTCDTGQSEANARRAVTDSKAVYYIGEFNSSCSKVTIPITNQVGLPQLSPANTLVGLTTNLPGSTPGEPQKYYPTGKRTYLRIVPIDKIQARAGLITMKQAGCSRVAVNNDKTAYGDGLATQVQMQAASEGITVTGDTALEPTSPNFRAYASSIKGQGVNCVYTAFNPTGEVELIKDINGAIPTAKVFGGDGVCLTSVTNPAKGGIPKSLAPLYFCTQPAQDLLAYPGGKAFVDAYKAKYGTAVTDPYAIYGYDAMKLGLTTIAKLGAQGNSKSAVLKALFATKNYHGAIGTYSFDANGDTTLTAYGVYKVGPDGNTLYYKTVG